MSDINQEIEMKKGAQVAGEVTQAISSDIILQSYVPFKGRAKIKTNYLNPSQIKDGMVGTIALTKDNMHSALTQALKIHRDNEREINYLLNYYKGDQEIFKRVKDIREDVDNKIVINYASTFTRDIIGYTFGKPLQYVIRKGDESIKDEIKLVSDYAEVADKYTSDQEKATNASIYGISHRGVFMNKDYEEDDESPFVYMNLNSESTFVAYSSQLGEKEVFACTYITTEDENNHKSTLYTVYTNDEVYMYRTLENSNFITIANLVEGYPRANPLGICIVENENNQFRMGHWETALTLMDAINKLGSDSVNDVEQFVNAILVAINVEFTEEMMNNVKKNKYAEIKSSQGLQGDLKYIRDQLDGASVEQLRQYLEDCLRVVVGIPDRKTRGGGGGDTGDAVKLRDGWADMEVVARTTEGFNKKSDKKEFKIILKIMKALKLVSKTSMINVDMKYPRNKTDNLVSKVQAMSTLHGMELMAPEDVLEIGDITTDNAEVVARGEEYWTKKKEQNFEDNQKLLASQGEDDKTQGGDEENADKQPTGNKQTDTSDKPRSGAKPFGSKQATNGDKKHI